MIVDLITVEEAATTAKVNRTSIYQHINKSGRLTRYTVNGKVHVERSELERLYPSTDEGVKQKTERPAKRYFAELFELREELEALKASIQE